MKIKWLLLFVAGCVTSLIALDVGRYFLPYGTGEYRDAPNNRYSAHATTIHRRTLLFGDDTYLEFKIVDTTTGKNIWQMTRALPSGVMIDYGDRRYRFIEWAPDSATVTFAIEDDHAFTVPVP